MHLGGNRRWVPLTVNLNPYLFGTVFIIIFNGLTMKAINSSAKC